jgi:MoxR-like ATPase
VQHRPPPDFPRRRLLDRCVDAHARVVRLIARPGWGKTTFARQIAAAYGEFAVVECREAASVAELDERLARALERGSD